MSLNADAPLTTQFILEDHAVRHSYHHLEKIRGALKAAERVEGAGREDESDNKPSAVATVDGVNILWQKFVVRSNG